MMKKTKVLIADDHDLVREGITKLLEFYDDLEVAGEAADGLETVKKVRDIFPDLILLDLNMPRMNGIDAIKKVKEISPGIKILILTIHDEEEYVYEVARAGAEGYVQKDIKPDALHRAINSVMKGNKVFPDDLVSSQETEQNKEFDIEELSGREYEVLQLLARGMSNRQIAGELFISEKTVKNHVSSVLRKLSVNDRTQAVILALKAGLVSLT